MTYEDIDDLRDKRLCHDCVRDTYLSEQIRKVDQISECSYCGQTGPCFGLAEMSELTERAFSKHYVRTSDQPDDWEHLLLNDKESDYEWERHGEPVVCAIMNAANIPEDAAKDIQEILADRYADFESAQMGEETEFDSDSYYQEKSPDDSYWQEEWENFERSLKSEARFFSQNASEHLAAIFDGIENMTTWDGKPLVVDAGPKTALPILYRARSFQSDRRLKEALGRPDRYLGTPPSTNAAAGRMNARGISVFYGANNAEVAIAEVRPPVGSQVAVARFEIMRPLRLLDLTAFGDASVKGSIFDPVFDRLLERTAFLRNLSERMTRPVMPDDEAFEYLATQAVADFLATRSAGALDGIIYPSVQAADGALNIVLFHRAALIEQLTLPEGTEIDVRLGIMSEDGWERDYSVSETVAPAVENEPVPSKRPLNLAALICPAADAPAWESETREATLKIDLESIEVHVVEKADYRTERHIVGRHRWEKHANERDDF